MTADRARGALAVLQDADGKFICEVPCGYIVEQTASAHKPRRIQAQRRRRRGILQSALRTRDRQVGSKGFQGSAGGGYPIVLLIPARTDTAYFHDYIYGKAEIRFVRGRLRFTDDDGNAADPAPFPSMVVIYNGERVKE